MIMNLEDLTTEEVEMRVLDGLETFGPLCLGQIYTMCDVTPEQAQVGVDYLLRRELIEICPDEGLVGPPDLTIVYGLPTGREKTVEMRS